MPLSAAKTALALAALFAVSMPFAAAEERCSGTVCDSRLGNATSDSTPGTPMTVPSGGILGFFSGPKAEPTAPVGAPNPTAAPAKPFVSVEGGGLLGALRGAPAERCSGTLCDFYYGGPPPERPQPASTGAAPRDGGGINSDIDRSQPPRSRNRRTAADEGSVSYAPRQVEKPQCVSPPNDPWKCYRK